MNCHVKKHGEFVSQDIRDTISKRYHTITKAINKEFWNSTNETDHSLYVGSYGRGTAIDSSDVDMLAILPEDVYERHDALKGNGQSRLLQAVKAAIQVSYPNSKISADGQVVKIDFSDGIKLEVVPAFEKYDYLTGKKYFTYPDTNNGGNWKSTNPKAEQKYMKLKDDSSHGLLKDTCRHIRRIHTEEYSSYHLSGILIDSFVFNAMQGWKWTSSGENSNAAFGDYENALLSYFNQHKYSTLFAPGSNMVVDTDDYYCLEKILKYMVGA